MTSSPAGSERTPSLSDLGQLGVQESVMCNVTHWPAATLSNAISCDFLKDFLLAIFGGKANGKRNYITRSKGKWMKWMALPKLGALRMAICDLKATASDIA